MKVKSLFTAILILLSSTSIHSQSKAKIVYDSKVDSILNLMTLEEKIGQLNQYNGFWDATGPTPKEGAAVLKYEYLKKGWVGAMLNVKGVKEVRSIQKIAVEQSRLGIPLLFGFDVIHGYKTISPIPLAEAASWDLDAIEKSAAIAAQEASSVGINWTFAPMVDVTRDARWGRVMEGAGEDPYLGSKIAAARVKGFQGNDLKAVNSILACAKHFAGYAFAESGRDYNTVDISDATLHNIVFPPFKACVDADVKTFMNSFNELNGIPATGNEYLQRKILKGDWQFNGFVVSDWGSINEMIAHGFAKDSKHAAQLAINAGSDMDMESNAYVENLALLVKENAIKVATIDDAVKRILKVKFELGLFDNPYKYCDEIREKETIGKKSIQDGVLDMALKSIVLLKNENEILPLQKSGLKIGVIGALAADKTSPLGSWRIAADDNSAISVMEGLQQYDKNQLRYAKGADLTIGETKFVSELRINTHDKSGFEEAIQLAKQSDVVIMVLGEHGLQSGEGRSRTSLDLPGVQQELLETIYNVNKKIVLILNNGRPLTIPWAAKNIPAIIEAWHLGTQNGNAIAKVLYGDYNPSGKLPITFPRSVGQVPIYYNYKNTGRPKSNEPNSVFWSHYTDEENTPQYAFGYGLSYSKFEYSNLKINKSKINQNESILVSITIKNNSKKDGKEVVQMYIQDVIASNTRPVKELKDFKITQLKAGETKTVNFEINSKTLAFYNNKNWLTEPGAFKIFVGGSSDKTLETNFEFVSK